MSKKYTNEKKGINIYDTYPSVLFFKGMFNEQKYQNNNQISQVNNNMIQMNLNSNSNNNLINI